jgi:prepilin-type processing-associated H-X9-DG protein
VQDSGRTTPLRIDADRAAGRVSLAWADGHASTYDAAALRWLCPCAYCRGEAGQPGWLDTSPSLTADQTTLVDLALVGSYAIQPTWGDGHHTGYYTFNLLRDRCPCADCTRVRAQTHATHIGGTR